MREALARRGGNPDLILMDLSLRGDENDLSLSRWLRAQEQFRRAPIVAGTANAMRERSRPRSRGWLYIICEQARFAGDLVRDFG
jgi:CheY-like chemotaxis protein